MRAALLRFSPLLALCVLTGCTAGPANPPTTQLATAIDPKTAEPAYWYDQPGVVSVESTNFDALWQACRLAARDVGFVDDVLNYRSGVYTTLPLISRQIFEPWKVDVVDTHSLLESTLSTMRRTARFEVHRVDGVSPPLYRVVPKVLVERFSMVEHRITSETEYRQIFTLTRRELANQRDRERDPTSGTPPFYWYSVGRDPALERLLAKYVRHYLHQPAPNLARASAQ